MSNGSKPPKKHHYIPVSYLSNFTNDGTDRSQLWVFDQSSGNQWQSRPKKIAYENDFHTIETVDGKDSKTFEEAFSMVEGNAKQIINEIIQTFKIPTIGSEEYNWLINFIALLSERTPARRHHFDKAMADVFKMASRVGFQNKSYFESQKKKIEEKTGKSFDLSYEQLNKLINEDGFEISFHNNFHMENFMARFDAIIEPLAHRKWSLCIAPPMYGDFVCSDNPVCLRNILPVKGILGSPGHGVLNTEVSIPLNPKVMLLGRFEDDLPPVGWAPSRRFVAQMNSWTAMYAERYVFSKKKDFLWWSDQGKVCTTEDFKRRLEHEKQPKFD
ncbi:DUF4238 domain-containing protein [Paenibacillus sp. NRS-1760]|uniref:DUF4238 domain-containing protein n=1 Tax=Paenibacillus sp. NRS-1760 TaxID=3233902 RepID=UPI003D2AE607